MVDAGYVNFSGENEDEELSVKVLRLVLLVLGLLLISLPFNMLVRKSWFTIWGLFIVCEILWLIIGKLRKFEHIKIMFAALLLSYVGDNPRWLNRLKGHGIIVKKMAELLSPFHGTPVGNHCTTV